MKNLSFLLTLAVMTIFAFAACNQDDDMDDDDDDPMVSDQTVMLECGDLSEDLTLTNSNASIDYLVNCSRLEVEGHIEIEPGTVIAFEEDANILVTSGSINAVGTEDDPIIFRGEETESGYWKGLGFESNSSNNNLTFVVIQDAGSDYIRCCGSPASLVIFDGKFRISNTTVRNGAAYGIEIHDEAEISEYSSVRVMGHNEAPLNIDILKVDDLDDASSDYTGNDKDYIEVNGSNINSSVEFRNQSVPYYLSTGSVIDITAPVTVHAGSRFLMAEETGIEVSENGYFNADGQSSQPITFEGVIASTGFWKGIEIASNNSNNNFNNVEIADAGNSYVTCCSSPASLIFSEGQASVRNTTLSDGAGYGLVISEGFQLLDYENLRITTHSDYPLRLPIEMVNELDGDISDYTGNTDDYILIEESTMDNPVTIEDANVAYRIDGTLDIESNLTINAGADFEFLADAGLNVTSSGSLRAVGTSGNRISMDPSASGSSGFWAGLYYNSNNIDNRLEYIDIRGAGSTHVRCCYEEAAIRIDDGTLVIDNASIGNVTGCGISYNSSSTVTIENVSYSNVTVELCEL